jgi:hypothetical protein
MSTIVLMVITPMALLFGVTVVLGFMQIPRIRRIARDFREMTKGEDSDRGCDP